MNFNKIETNVVDRLSQNTRKLGYTKSNNSNNRSSNRTNTRASNKTRRSSHSYRPTINQKLVSFKSLKRTTLNHCNTVKAFKLMEVLKIAVSKNKCVQYDTQAAKKVLLDRLRANKHVTISKIIPPKQIDGNCWFNVMFVMFFVSDKGRKFFHFFRQLMIEGKDISGKPIPEGLKDAFALLNYGVELALTGSKYALTADTNFIIVEIFNNIPDEYKYNKISRHKDVPDELDAGNPIDYYNAIMNYLNVNSVSMMEQVLTPDWQITLANKIKNMPKPPHIIIMPVYQDGITNKLTKFKINNIKYMIDSASVINDKREHFSCCLTCEGKEMAFDGMSAHRIVPMQWKKNLNKNIGWGFEGSVNKGVPLVWNFQTCYQQLIYYRTR